MTETDGDIRLKSLPPVPHRPGMSLKKEIATTTITQSTPAHPSCVMVSTIIATAGSMKGWSGPSFTGTVIRMGMAVRYTVYLHAKLRQDGSVVAGTVMITMYQYTPALW